MWEGDQKHKTKKNPHQKKKKKVFTAKMAYLLLSVKVLALLEDLGLVPSTHLVAHNLLRRAHTQCINPHAGIDINNMYIYTLK